MHWYENVDLQKFSLIHNRHGSFLRAVLFIYIIFKKRLCFISAYPTQNEISSGRERCGFSVELSIITHFIAIQ